MHWPTPAIHDGVTHDRGPVLITIQYDVEPDHAADFVEAITRLGRSRRRDGAFAWGVYEDTAREHRYIETFCIESWLEHLRQHERVTDADRILQQELQTYLEAGSEPSVTHYVAPTTNQITIEHSKESNHE